MQSLAGYKTYIASASMALASIVAWFADVSDVHQALFGVLSAAAFAALRQAIASLSPDKSAEIQRLARIVETLLAQSNDVRAKTIIADIEKALPSPLNLEPTKLPPSSAATAGFIAALLLCPALANAAAPLKAVVHAPQIAVPGDDVFLDSSPSTGDILKRHWRVEAVPPTAIVPGRKQFDATDPVKPRLLSYAGKYTCTLTVVGSDGELDTTSVVIDLGAPAPQPCPDNPPPAPKPIPEPQPTPIPHPQPVPMPTPQPQPMPVPPQPPQPPPTPKPSEFGLAPLVAHAAKAVGDPAGCIKLAGEATDLSTRIKSGSVTSVQAVLNEIAADVKAAGPKWTPVLAAVKTLLEGLVLSGKLNQSDVAPWARVLDEVAQGLQQAAQP